MEHLPDDSPRYYTRENASHLIDSFENLFIGNMLIKAADHVADIADLDLSELVELGRDLGWSIERPDADGLHKYEFIIAVAEGIDEPNHINAPFDFILSHHQTTVVPVAELSAMQKSHLIDQVINMEDIDDKLLKVLSPGAPADLQNSVGCTLQLNTRYNCSQYDSTITKTVTANYYVGDTEITSVGFDFEAELDGETESVGDTTELTANPFLLADIGSSLAVIQPEDMLDLYEILYYLNLPGGVIATEVTADYADDDSRIISERS